MGIIGAVNYGTAIITQSGAIPHYAITFVADMNLDAAKKACTQAGWDADSISVVETEADVRRARNLGKVVVTASPELISACDVEVMEIPRDSLLWRLRREQDALFGTHSP